MKLDRSTLLLVTVVVAFLTLLFVINKEAPASFTPVDKIKVNTPVSNVTVLISNENVCEGCHMSGKKFIPQADIVKPHLNGGAFCLSCHKISHEKHPVNQNITCEACHGTAAQIPAFINGSISCNNCHDYPDPLLPSKGDILTIHKPRGITCNACHTELCTKCHAEMGKSERWEKRLGHFRVMPGTS